MKVIKNTLSHNLNESPYWMVLDQPQHKTHLSCGTLYGYVHGPFFSHVDAKEWIMINNHNCGPTVKVISFTATPGSLYDRFCKGDENAEQAIISVLSRAPGEATRSPYWTIVDPPKKEIRITEKSLRKNTDGIFFCRDNAEQYIDHYIDKYSDRVHIACSSGFRSPKYDEFCTRIRERN